VPQKCDIKCGVINLNNALYGSSHLYNVTCFKSSISLAEGTGVKQQSAEGVVGVLLVCNFSKQKNHKPHLIIILFSTHQIL